MQWISHTKIVITNTRDWKRWILVSNWNPKPLKITYSNFLRPSVSDALPQFFCQLCSIKMKRFHLLIEKAIETQKYLEQKLQESFSLPVVKNEIEEETECVYMPDICFEITTIDSLEEAPESELPSQEEEANSTEEDSRNELSETQTGNLTENENDLESNGENGDGENESMVSVEEKKNNRSKLETRKGAMCSYCCKFMKRKACRPYLGCLILYFQQKSYRMPTL